MNFTSEGRFVDLQVAQFQRPQVRRHFVPGLQEDDVARHQVGGGDDLTRPAAEHGGTDAEFPRQGIDGSQRIQFLHEADDGVEENHAEDHAGIHPALQDPGHRSRDQQDVDQRVMELGQKKQDGAFSPLRCQAVLSDALEPAFRLFVGKSLGPVGLQPRQRFLCREAVPRVL